MFELIMFPKVLPSQAGTDRNSFAITTCKLCFFFSLIMCGVRFPQIFVILRALLFRLLTYLLFALYNWCNTAALWWWTPQLIPSSEACIMQMLELDEGILLHYNSILIYLPVSLWKNYSVIDVNIKTIHSMETFIHVSLFHL